MNYTLVMTEAERERRAENRLNELLRRCRIGKVKSKRNQGGVLYGPPWDLHKFPLPLSPSWPGDTGTTPTPMFMSKCGCKVGSSCNNVACPHMVRATWGSPSMVPSHGVMM